MSNYSPLRYPGGKRRLVGLIKDIIEQNDLRGGTYIEPFSGGAAIALALAIDGDMERVIINDADRSIYAFWYSILNHHEKFIEKVEKIQLSIEEWRRQYIIQKNKNNASLFDLGFSTFYLNRTNRSGVLKAGPIGGINQNGNYKMDARFNREQLIERIALIVEHKDQFILHNDDALDLLRRYRNISRRNLVYFDPPYFVKGRALYVNYYNETDHVALARMITGRRNVNWIVTYDEHPFIQDLYQEYPSVLYDLSYSAGATKSGREVLFSSERLIIPNGNIIRPMQHR